MTKVKGGVSSRPKPLPDDEMPQDREWTDEEWLRNQWYLANLECELWEKEAKVGWRWRRQAVELLEDTGMTLHTRTEWLIQRNRLLADQPTAKRPFTQDEQS